MERGDLVANEAVLSTVNNVNNSKNVTKKKRKLEVVNSFNIPSLKCATSSAIKINSEVVDCLIDTGAYTSFVSDEFAIKHKFKRNKITSRKRWVTANGTPIEIAGQTSLILKIGNKNIEANFVIAKNLAQNVIIGVDILKPNNCVVDFSTNKLLCENESIDIKTYNSIKPKTIYSNCNITIEPYESYFLSVTCPINFETVLITKLGKVNVLETLSKKDN